MLLTLEIPDAAISSLHLTSDQLHRELLLDLAVGLYCRGALPVGKAMDMTNLSRRDFDDALKLRNARRPLDKAELESEQTALEQLKISASH